MASELKIASALVLESRSPISSSWWSGRPRTMPRAFAMSRPLGVVGTLAASLAVSWPFPVYRKYGACGRSTRTRLSPGLRPCSDRRPPIMRRPSAMARSQAERQPRGEPLRQPRGPHVGLDAIDVVRDAVPGHPPYLPIDHEIGGTRVTVSRLADAAGVDQHPVGTEVDRVRGSRLDQGDPFRRRSPGCGHVGVAVQGVLGLLDGHVVLGGGTIRDVLAQRIAGASVDE